MRNPGSCNSCFGVNIGPTRVAVSPVGTFPAVGPGRGGMQHYALRITLPPQIPRSDRLSFYPLNAHSGAEAFTRRERTCY